MTNAQETRTRRDQLLRSTREAHTRLEELLAGLSEEEQTRPGVTDGWSVKDHLAHLTWWEQRVIRMLAGDPDPISAFPGNPEDEDAINAYVFAQNRDRPLTDVRTAFDASYQQMLHLIATTPDDVFDARHDWISGNADSHYDEHLRMLQSWRERTPGASGAG
jgi:uncharacterized damage-inducible protein DinB